jgi:hypothetical protein
MSKAEKPTNHGDRDMSKKAKDLHAYRNQLPFFKASATGRQAWWNVNPTGDYEADYQTGEEYALAFWKVTGGRGTCGLELGQILFAMHDPLRPKTDSPHGLSGIEIGFVRTIGVIIDFATSLPAFVDQVAKRRKKIKITPRQVRGAAKIMGVLLDIKHKDDIKQRAKFERTAAA